MIISNPPAPTQVTPTVGGGMLQFMTFDIGAWNMDSTVTTTLAHGIADISKIVHISALIVTDNGITITPLDMTDGINEHPGGCLYIDATDFGLIRRIGGYYDNAAYSSAVVNRGKVYIVIEA